MCLELFSISDEKFFVNNDNQLIRTSGKMISASFNTSALIICHRGSVRRGRFGGTSPGAFIAVKIPASARACLLFFSAAPSSHEVKINLIVRSF